MAEDTTTTADRGDVRSGGAYYSKWDRVAEWHERELDEESNRLEAESNKAMGIDPAAPKSHNEAEHRKRKEALKQAKKDWEARKQTEAAAKKTISGETGKECVLDGDGLDRKPVLVLAGNVNCTYTIPDVPLVKMLVESCKNCTFLVQANLLTQHLEIFNCESCTFRFERVLKTVQVDQCAQRIALNYAREDFLGQVFSSGIEALDVTVDEPSMEACVTREYLEEAAAAHECSADHTELSTLQFVTQVVGGALLTEEVVRVGDSELPTTRRELAEKGMGEGAVQGAKQKAERKKLEGNALFRKEDYGQAAVCYTDAITLDPALHVCYANRSACFLKLGQHEKALEDAMTCVELDPGYVKGWFRKGLALHALARYGEAISAFGKAIELEPTNKQAKDAVRMAEFKARQQQPQL
mmetsp:Transcript_7123/g.26200  ORF Transcript_7123/g.26200 Transcript_7123/m.26200 type:complete len:412 (+) Transcript_7123:61-1296(+)